MWRQCFDNVAFGIDGDYRIIKAIHFSNGLTLSDVEAARGVAMVSSSPSSPSMASARYLTATAQSTTVPMMQRCSKHRLKTSPKRKIPFIKANGFCSQDYVVQSSPGSSSEVAELKWDLRSQIHPTSIAVSAPSPTAAAADTEQVRMMIQKNKER